MKTIRLLRNVCVAGTPRSAGDVVVVADEIARQYVQAARARMADDADAEPIRRRVAQVGDLLAIATAVPGGKRPGRKVRPKG